MTPASLTFGAINLNSYRANFLRYWLVSKSQLYFVRVLFPP